MSTFKNKIGIGAVVLVVLVTIVMYLLIVPPWADRLRTQTRADVVRAADLIQHMQRLRAYDLVALATRIALQPSFAKALNKDSTSAKRQAVFDAITRFDGSLRSEGRKAHFFAVVGKNGRVIARDLNIEDMHDDPLPYASVRQALKGAAASDVWFLKGRMMRAAAAPIRRDGEVSGAVVIAYDFSAAEAREEARLVRADVLYVADQAIRASSFAAGDGEDSSKVKHVNKALFTGDNPGAVAMKEGKLSDVFSADIDGQEYLIMAGSLPHAVKILGLQLSSRPTKSGKTAEKIVGTSAHSVGYAVMVNLDTRLAFVSRTRLLFALLGLAFLLVVLGVMWGVARHFVSAEDRLELGVSEVINGNLDYTFDALQEFEGLANALNVMLARLLGRPEPGEEEDGDAAWRPEVLNIEDLGASAVQVDVQQLAAQSEETYYANLHKAYVEARSAAGLSVEGITPQSFIQKVRANEAMISAKYKCNMVRFVVRSAGGKVSLTPVRIS